jgi:hypothetical protein
MSAHYPKQRAWVNAIVASAFRRLLNLGLATTNRTQSGLRADDAFFVCSLTTGHWKRRQGVRQMSEKERVGITPKSWTAQRHHGVLHLGKRWYVLSADIDEAGTARGVRLDGPYADHDTAEAQVERHHEEPFPRED